MVKKSLLYVFFLLLLVSFVFAIPCQILWSTDRDNKLTSVDGGGLIDLCLKYDSGDNTSGCQSNVTIFNNCGADEILTWVSSSGCDAIYDFSGCGWGSDGCGIVVDTDVRSHTCLRNAEKIVSERQYSTNVLSDYIYVYENSSSSVVQLTAGKVILYNDTYVYANLTNPTHPNYSIVNNYVLFSEDMDETPEEVPEVPISYGGSPKRIPSIVGGVVLDEEVFSVFDNIPSTNISYALAGVLVVGVSSIGYIIYLLRK